MLKALNKVAGRLREEKKLLPTSYKLRFPKTTAPIRIIDLSTNLPIVEQFKTPGSMPPLITPDRQRSGNAPDPYLLYDSAEYVFGIAKSRKHGNSKELHKRYVDLLLKAFDKTRERSLWKILNYVQESARHLPQYLDGIEPNEFVAIRTETVKFPFDLKSVQEYWGYYLENELPSDTVAVCLVCGKEKPIMQKLTRDVVIMGQKCSVSSFNNSSFLSFGKSQTTNSPLCFQCASTAIDALDYLSRSDRNTAVLSRDDSKSKTKTPLRNQLAVFWLTKVPQAISDDKIIDCENAFAAPIKDSKPGSPPPDLSQLEELLKVPFTAREAGLVLDDESFCLAVLSANKGRLVVREWIKVQLDRLRNNLKKFLDASRLVSSAGFAVWPHSITFLLRPFNVDEKAYPKRQKPVNNSPNLRRGLLRTAYIGYSPPQELLGLALTRLQVLWVKGEEADIRKEKERIWQVQALMAGIKLVLTYGKEDANKMVKLDEDYEGVPYLCGRLLATIGECQWRASKVKNIERYYATASTAPAVYLSLLFDRTNAAYLPKIRRDKNGYVELSGMINGIAGLIDPKGGFPVSLTLDQKAEFALGYYHQKAKIAEDKANKFKK